VEFDEIVYFTVALLYLGPILDRSWWVQGEMSNFEGAMLIILNDPRKFVVNVGSRYPEFLRDSCAVKCGEWRRCRSGIRTGA
jgi:hypothetical protein